IPDAAQWSTSSNTLVSDWAVGPWYQLYGATTSIQTIWDPVKDNVSGSNAPYMVGNWASYVVPVDTTNYFGMKKAPPSAYLALCTPPIGASGYSAISTLQYKTSSSTTPPTFCPDTGAYPYYTLNS